MALGSRGAAMLEAAREGVQRAHVEQVDAACLSMDAFDEDELSHDLQGKRAEARADDAGVEHDQERGGQWRAFDLEGGGCIEGAADREPGIIDRLNLEVGVAVEPALAGELQRMRQHLRHGERSQDDAYDLEGLEHARPNDRSSSRVAASSSSRSRARA